MNAIRWSDNDKYLGPFTFARDRRYKPFSVVLGSGDGDEYAGCNLHMSAFGLTLIAALPQMVKPWRKWVDTSHYSWSEDPDSGYWDTGSRNYGFRLSEGFLSINLGRVTNDSSTEQCWSYFLPWTQWRSVREALYDADGKTFYERRGKSPKYGTAGWDAQRAAKDTCPTVTFAFKDFDEEPITAKTRLEETEMRRGTGKFKWVSLFCKRRVWRSLDIQFSGETGKRKGSWKGGTLGHGIDVFPGELHEAAFRRYCEKHDMKFVGVSL